MAMALADGRRTMASRRRGFVRLGNILSNGGGVADVPSSLVHRLRRIWRGRGRLGIRLGRRPRWNVRHLWFISCQSEFSSHQLERMAEGDPKKLTNGLDLPSVQNDVRLLWNKDCEI
jgi:hypothetical protein